MQEPLKLTLSLTVAYDLNGEDPETLKQMLIQLANHAMGTGMITGDTAAEVHAWDAGVTGLGPKLQTELFVMSDGPRPDVIHFGSDPGAIVDQVNTVDAVTRWLDTLEAGSHVYIDDDGMRLKVVGNDDVYLELGGHPLPLLTEEMFDAYLEGEFDGIDPEQAFRELCLEGDGDDWRRRQEKLTDADLRCKLELDDRPGFRMGLNNYADGQVRDRQWISFDNGGAYYTTEDVKKALFHFDESEYDYDPALRSQVDWWL